MAKAKDDFDDSEMKDADVKQKPLISEGQKLAIADALLRRRKAIGDKDWPTYEAFLANAIADRAGDMPKALIQADAAYRQHEVEQDKKAKG
jgi:hypothetical protein